MPIKREPVNTSDEDKIVIGMVVSDDFLKSISGVYKPEYINSPYNKTVAQWCLNHFDQYGKAPGLHIKDIFDQHVRQGLDHSTADLVELFLDRISNEYAKAPHIDVNFMLDEAERFFKRKALKQLSEDIRLAIEQNEDEQDIHDLVADVASSVFDTRGYAFEDSLVTSTELLAKKVKPPRAIVWPWLREGSLSMIYARRGVGKSWLGMIIAVAVTREDYRDIMIGPWYVKNPCGVLFVDGEMGEYDMQDRLAQIINPLGKESRKFPLLVFHGPDYNQKHNKTVNIMHQYWQDRFYDLLKNNRRIKLLILDNLSSLSAGRDENDNQATSLFNQWLIKVRALGVSVIIVHHAGKSGDQRGASILEDALNNTICLKRPKDAQAGGMHFEVEFTKARNDPGGEGYRNFELRLIEDENPRWRRWEMV